MVKKEKNNSRVTKYLIVNFLFFLLIFFLSILNKVSFSYFPFLYLCLLFSICFSTILFSKRLNGKYAILNFFTILYFIFYGAGDILYLIFPEATIYFTERPVITNTEIAALLGIFLYVLGYKIVISNYKNSSKIKHDWKPNFTFNFGVFIWAIGLFGTWIFQFNFSDTRADNVVFGNITVILVLLKMVQPLGTAMIIYRYLTKPSSFLLFVVIGLMTVEFVFGFVADSKELSIRAFVILLILSSLIYGKVPKKWLLLSVCLFAASFSVFQAYRQAIFHDRDQNRQESLSNLSSNLNKALKSKTSGGFKAGIHGFIGRMNLKGNLNTVITRTGYDVDFQDGYTIELLLYAFIPRYILPNKADSSVGQLFNREFKISEDKDTYISATHLAELYWNYGWPGLILGMFIIGSLMGYLSSRWSMKDSPSIVNSMLIFSTLYLLCFRFEGGIALQYTLWARSIVLILLMNYVVGLMGFVVRNKTFIRRTVNT